MITFEAVSSILANDKSYIKAIEMVKMKKKVHKMTRSSLHKECNGRIPWLQKSQWGNFFGEKLFRSNLDFPNLAKIWMKLESLKSR